MAEVEGILGEPSGETLSKFRRYTRSHIDSFNAARDRIFHLLGPRQQHASGSYREGLIKDFFRSLLPTAVSVDSGFIYAFDMIPTSAQLDVIIWYSEKHAPVYRGRDFVIVSPEAAISVISVKSNLHNRDLQQGLENLLSVTPIELRFRQFPPVHGNHTAIPPITKFLVGYATRRRPASISAFVSNYYKKLFAENADLARVLTKVYSDIDPFRPSEAHTSLISRIFPRMIATVDVRGSSFFIGYGPPSDLQAHKRFGPGLRRLPYLYKQRNNKTTSFEKLCFEVLESVYRIIGTVDWPTTSAWININPVTGVSPGDAWEIEEDSGVPLVDPDCLPG